MVWAPSVRIGHTTCPRQGEREEDQLPTPTIWHYASLSAVGRVYNTYEFCGRFDCNCPGKNGRLRYECCHILDLRRIYRMPDPDTTAVAIRKNGPTDLIPEGYEPIEINVRERRLPTEMEFDMMMRIASTAKTAGEGMLPASIKSAESAMAVMLAGHEINVPPFTALRRLYPVNGKIEIETQLLMGIVKAGARAYGHEVVFRFDRYDATGAEVTGYLDGEKVITCSYTDQDAQRSQQGWRRAVERWEKKDGRNVPVYKRVNGRLVYEPDPESPWVRYPRDMYAYNACKRVCRLGFPEYANGVGLAGGAIPQQALVEAAPNDKPELANPVSRGLIEGTIKAAELDRQPETPADDVNIRPPAGDDDEGIDVEDQATDGEFADVPPPEVEVAGPPDPLPAPETPATAPTEVTATPPEEAPPEGPLTPETRARIDKTFGEIKQTEGPSYADFYRETVAMFFPGAPANAQLGRLLEAANEGTGRAIYARGRRRLGDPDFEDQTASTEPETDA